MFWWTEPFILLTGCHPILQCCTHLLKGSYRLEVKGWAHLYIIKRQFILIHIIITMPMAIRPLAYLEKLHCERKLQNSSTCLWALWFCHYRKMPISSQIWSPAFGKESHDYVASTWASASVGSTWFRLLPNPVWSQPYTCTVHHLSSLLTQFLIMLSMPINIEQCFKSSQLELVLLEAKQWFVRKNWTVFHQQLPL